MHYLYISFAASILVLILFVLVIHLGYRAPRIPERKDPSDWGLRFDVAFIPGAHGKKLHTWWIPISEEAPTLILMHGWGGNMELMLPLALPFRHAGMNVFLLDARNHGKSDPDSYSAMPRFAEDVGCAIDWVKTRAKGKIVLLGHSVGAGAVLLEASRRDDIDAVVSIAAFAHPEWVMRRQLERYKLPKVLINAVLRYIEWVIGHRFVDIAPMNTACRALCPVLLVHGTDDRTVPLSDAHAIVGNCPDRNLQLLEIAGADHDSTDRIDPHAPELLAYLHAIGVLA
ncbi:MAG TPA: alpha/beta fold hydrolase, partial [Chromatiales bacterium]|nr:alpha/beta fold hydrolase [Chromatiales bacterium]